MAEIQSAFPPGAFATTLATLQPTVPGVYAGISPVSGNPCLLITNGGANGYTLEVNAGNLSFTKVGSGTTAATFYADALVKLLQGFAASNIATPTTTFTVGVGNVTVLANAAGGAFAVTLTSVALVATGQYFTIKKTDSSVNAVTVTAPAGSSIDGAATFALSAQYQFVTVVADSVGAYWITATGTA